MVTPLLRELAGSLRPFLRLGEPLYVHDHGARELIAVWNRACRHAIQTGAADELHADRDAYRAALLGHLKILDGYAMLLKQFNSEEVDFVNRIARARDELQAHSDALFPRWQTLEDLEAILLERASIPNDRLKELAAKYPPPPAWYDEADAPPAPQE